LGLLWFRAAGVYADSTLLGTAGGRYEIRPGRASSGSSGEATRGPAPINRCYRTDMLFSGTSGWAYPSWKPGFYPARLPPSKFLSFYAARLNSVEVNYTFRRLAGESLFRKWIGETPPQFRFAVKAHQAITHFRRLRDAGESCSLFL